jgi:hypothetical protein
VTDADRDDEARLAEQLSGLELTTRYAADVVGPLLDRHVPDVPVALARLGSGSDLLGFDDAISRDHDWGLRLTVLVPGAHVARVDALLEAELPASFLGLPVRFPTTWEPRVRHRAEVVDPHEMAASRAGVRADRELTTEDWLSLTGQGVLEVIGGPVLRDDDGVLTAIRARLARYPEPIRRHVLAAGWARIGQELPFLGRTALRGDEAGSRVIAGRLVRTLMHLGIVLEGGWAPYGKWLGSAFAALPVLGPLAAELDRAITAGEWGEREASLVRAIDAIATRQGELGLPTRLPATEPFWDRPFAGLRDLPEAMRESIDDPAVRALPLVGVPEQWSDSVDLLVDHERRRRMQRALLAG